MGVEIERKFLVSGPAWRKAARRRVAMEQGYLSGTRGKASVRVRIEGRHARLNIKAAVVGMRRAEFDYAVPVADARELMKLATGRVHKTRHYVRFGGLTWEIDEFRGANRGLVVAEVELKSTRQHIARPPWLGREVTREQRYYNHALALHPYSRWNAREQGSLPHRAKD